MQKPVTPFPSFGEKGNLQDENQVCAELIRQARGGSIEAFEHLYERTVRWLLSHVRRLVPDGQAEDVLAEVYVQVWKSLDTYDAQRAPPAVWLVMIARSRALDHLRRERRHGATCRAQQMQDATDRTSPSPEQLLSQSQQCRLMQSSLTTAPLSAQERLVLGLAYYRDSTYQEIAVLTGLSPGVVKSLMLRAQHKLREQLAVQAPCRTLTVQPETRREATGGTSESALART